MLTVLCLKQLQLTPKYKRLRIQRIAYPSDHFRHQSLFGFRSKSLNKIHRTVTTICIFASLFCDTVFSVDVVFVFLHNKSTLKYIHCDTDMEIISYV